MSSIPKRLAWAFIAFGFLGWLIESLLLQKLTYDHMLYNLFGIRVPFLFIYALAGIFLVLLRRRLSHIPTVLKILALAIIVTAYELVSGLAGQLMGHRYWDYSSHPFNFLGYISLYSFLWWILWMAIFELLSNRFSRKTKAKASPRH